MLETLIAILLIVVIVVGITLGLTLLRAFVLIKMWEWFIVPLFSLPALNIPYALGLSLIVGMFMQNIVKTEDNKKTMLTIILAPLATLSLGWIVHLFI